jgi:hypothetical protein
LKSSLKCRAAPKGAAQPRRCGVQTRIVVTDPG